MLVFPVIHSIFSQESNWGKKKNNSGTEKTTYNLFQLLSEKHKLARFILPINYCQHKARKLPLSACQFNAFCPRTFLD